MSDGNFEQIEIPDLNGLNLATNGSGDSQSSQRDYHLPERSDQAEHDIPAEDDEKPTAEYALHILFTRFVRYTEKKLAILQTLPEDAVESVIGEGADPEFDLILESLGHVARRRPKPVIDSIMYWRKTKREQPNVSLASLYVLCRALMEVIRQTPHEILGERLSEKLEEIVFKQLVSTDPEVVASNGIRGANWRYLARLLGEMSSFRLASADDRFLAELETKNMSKAQEAKASVLLEAMQYLKIKLYPEEFLEESSAFLESISKFYTNTSSSSPLRNKYAKTISHILEPLAEAITVEVNQPMWASTMQSLFKASQEKQPGTGITSRTNQFTGQSSPSSSSAVFSLSVMSLCLSPQSMFLEHWLKLLETNVQKYKTKPMKVTNLLPAAARLTWVYIFRCSESLNLTTKKIEALKKMFLSNTSRKYWQTINADLELRQACVSLIRSCFQGYQQFTLDELLFPMLVGTDATSLAQQHAIAYDSAVLPERAGIACDAFVDMMKDLKSGIRPSFPSNRVDTALAPSNDGLPGAKESTQKTELPHRPSVSSALQASIDLFGTCIGQVSQWLEQGGGTPEVSSRQNSVSHLVSIASGGNSSQVQPETQNYDPGIKTAEQQLLLLFIRSWPSWWSPEQHIRHLDVLCRCVNYKLEPIHLAAAMSLRKIAESVDLKTLFTPFTKAMMAADAKSAEINESFRPAGSLNNSGGNRGSEDVGSSHGTSASFHLGSTNSLSIGLGLHAPSNSQDIDIDLQQSNKTRQQRESQVSRHLMLYVEIIEIWVSRLQNGDAAVHGPSVDSQLLNLWSVVEEIEGNGLFFLCSQDMFIRSLGLRILWLTTSMDQAILNYQESQQSEHTESKPSRIINLLQNTPISKIVTQGGKKFSLSMPERNRLAKFRSKRASLARLAESTYGVDSALWLKLFPFVISLCFDTHPIPVALCRNLVSDRLVQMHEVMAEISSMAPSVSSNYATVAIIEQWKIYLVVACATLTSTEEQKLHVPTSSVSTSSFGTMHSRKRSHQKITLHHQHITSARSVFRIVAPVLRSQNNAVREAVVTGLSCTNVNTYKTLLECLQPILSESIQRIQQINASQVKNAANVYESLLRSITCITQILRQTTMFLEHKEIRQDVWIRTEVVSVLQQLREVVGTMHSMQGMSLRISFCELLADTYMALKPSLMFSGRNPAAEWLQFWTTVEMWSPYGSNATSVLEQRAALNRRAPNDVVLAQFEITKRDLDRATSRALAALFVDSQGFVSDLNAVQQWVFALLASNSDSVSQDIGRIALENLLVSHASRPELLQEVVSRCYHNSSERSRGVAKVYFVALVNMLESHPDLIKRKVDKPQQFLALALFKIGDPDCETRFRAVKLIEMVENGLYGSSVIGGEYQFRLRSSSPSVYKREIFVLSGKLAAERRQESFYLFSQMTRAFQAVNDSDRRDILSVLLPWIQHIEFKHDDGLGLQMVLVNLLGITTVFSGRMQHEVEALWVALCTSTSGVNSNALRILEFLLTFCLQHRTPGSVSVSRTVLIYLLSSPASSAITERLLSYLEPSCMITQGSKNGIELVSPACKKEFPYVASINEIVSLANEKEGNTKNLVLPPFSYGQLAVVFLVDTISAPAQIAPKLASLIHISVVLGDHFVGLVQEKSRELLLNIAGMLNPDPVGMRKFTELIATCRWRYEDDNGTVPDQLSDLVSNILSHMGDETILDYREWAQVAINWATTNPVRHIACRSLQIYRCLDLQLDLKMLGDLLARLSSTISEQAMDIQGFATQTLMTLNSIIDKLDKDQLLSYAPLFWASVAALSSANEPEYMEALSAVSKLLSKWTEDFAIVAISSFPSRWEHPLSEFPGILNLVLRGLRSQNASDLSHDVVNQLIMLSASASEHDALLFFGGKNSLPHLLAASLPWLLHAMDQPHLITFLSASTQILECLVRPYSGGLGRILDSFVKRRLWSRSDFLRQYVLALPVAFPKDITDIMVLTMSMVNNGTHFIRRAALDILRTLVPEVDLKQASMRWRGADLIAPLLRLLTTTDVEDSLSVLDIVASVKPDRMDKDVLRMTLGSRQLFHEYENTQTLFGIPDEFGWSVPMPAQASASTRANVHAVFYTCVSEKTADSEVEFENIDENSAMQEFQTEDFAPSNSLYRQHSAQASVSQIGMESMNKILTDLDEFDSFFTRVAAPQETRSQRYNSPGSSNLQISRRPSSRSSSLDATSEQLITSGTPTSQINVSQTSTPPRRRSTSESESIPQLYDKKVSLILNRSLARTPSQVSFRTSFADFMGRSGSVSGGSANPNVNGGGQIPGSYFQNSARPTHNRQQSSTYFRALYGQGLGDYPSAGSLVRTRSQASTESTNTTIADAQDFENSLVHPETSAPSIHSDTEPKVSTPINNSLRRFNQVTPHSSNSRESAQQLDTFDFFEGPSESPTPAPANQKKKSKKSQKSQPDSSFRLESLLRGKRKGKPEKELSENYSSASKPAESFQFPPRS